MVFTVLFGPLEYEPFGEGLLENIRVMVGAVVFGTVWGDPDPPAVRR